MANADQDEPMVICGFPVDLQPVLFSCHGDRL